MCNVCMVCMRHRTRANKHSIRLDRAKYLSSYITEECYFIILHLGLWVSTYVRVYTFVNTISLVLHDDGTNAFVAVSVSNRKYKNGKCGCQLCHTNKIPS